MAAGADLLAGLRVAELPGLSPGRHDLVMTLFAGDAVVADRAVRIDLQRSLALTVLVTRDCADVSCDEETTCRAAACVDVGCSELAPELCGAPECATDAECPAPVDRVEAQSIGSRFSPPA